MAEPRYIVNVAAALLRGDRYLLIVRGAGETHAPGTLSLPGGKVEGSGQVPDVLEATLRRELAEEVGLAPAGELAYVQSNAFVTDYGVPVVNVVFLGRCPTGEAVALDADEVAAIAWLTAAEVVADPACPPWTRDSVALADVRRLQLGW